MFSFRYDWLQSPYNIPDLLSRYSYFALKKDIAIGIRSEDVTERSLNRLSSFNELNTVKIQTDNRSIDQIADMIISL